MSTLATPVGMRPDALSLAKASPAFVKEHDRSGWLDLFTADASVEDPVGAGAHVGRERLRSFWDVFIAPHRSSIFFPHRDFAHRDVAIRYVTISTLTPAIDQPFEIPAVIEYRTRGDRIASLRAFWEPREAVRWHAKHGAKGWRGLLKHGARTTTGLGLGSAMGFGLAMRPKVGKRDAQRVAAALEHAIGGSEDAWRSIATGEIAVAPHGDGELLTTATAAWRDAMREVPPMRLEETLIAGDHVACVLGSEHLAAAVIARLARGRVERIAIYWSMT